MPAVLAAQAPTLVPSLVVLTVKVVGVTMTPTGAAPASGVVFRPARQHAHAEPQDECRPAAASMCGEGSPSHAISLRFQPSELAQPMIRERRGKGFITARGGYTP